MATSLSAASKRIAIHDGSSSERRRLNFGERGNAWWLLCRLSPPVSQASTREEEAGVVGGVLEVLAAPPVAQAVDQGRQDEHIDDAVAEHGQDALPPADRQRDQRRAEEEPGPAPREDVPLPPVRAEIGREDLHRLGLPGLAD